MDDFSLEPASPELIRQVWRDFTGVPIVSVSRTYDDSAEVKALVYRDEEGRVGGHVSFAADAGTGEIVTIEAVALGKGIGGRLIAAAEEDLRSRGVKRIVVTTTNDNLRAQAFYQRRGYRLTRIEIDGMQRVRELKPSVPLIGHEGLPLLDMWEFEKTLA